MNKLCFALLIAALFACGAQQPAPAPHFEADASDLMASCESACSQLRSLGCQEGKPTPKGASCEAVCVNAQNEGFVRWDLSCISRASSCDAARGCM